MSIFRRSRARVIAGLVSAAAVASLVSTLAFVPSAGAAIPRNPVVIVAGMGVPTVGYETLATRLRFDGYRVSIFQSSSLGLGDIHDSALELAAFVDAVRTQQNAAKIDLVGHSAGGLVARDFVKTAGGAAVVDKIVALGTPHYGTINADIGSFFGIGPCAFITACSQLTLGNSYLAGLNAGDDSIGSVRYWSFATKTDEVVQPYRNAFLDTSDGNIVNVAIQDQCWFRFVGHAGLILEGPTYTGVRQALQGNTRIRLNCFAL
jgi:triacylglycerol esterase/lipase EstA (alpha/beta hydrolase family)